MLNTVVLSAYDNKLDFMFWFDSTPPTKENKKFFNDVKVILTKLNNNNSELEERCRRKGIPIFSLNDSRKVYYKYERELNIPRSFFYDLEKTQFISSIKMYTNLCHLTSGCTNNQVNNFIKNQLIKGGYNYTNKNRNLLSKNRNDARNSALLFAFGGAVIIEMISNSVESKDFTGKYPSNNDKYCSTDEECYSIIKSKRNETTIRCKGYLEGSEHNIQYDSSISKYYIRGFLVNNYERSFKKLANSACGVY